MGFPNFSYYIVLNDKLNNMKLLLPSLEKIITSCFPNLVGGDFTNRRKEIDYRQTEQKINDPIVTTEVNLGSENGVLIMDAKNENRPTSFFAQPGILAGKLQIMI